METDLSDGTKLTVGYLPGTTFIPVFIENDRFTSIQVDRHYAVAVRAVSHGKTARQWSADFTGYIDRPAFGVYGMLDLGLLSAMVSEGELQFEMGARMVASLPLAGADEAILALRVCGLDVVGKKPDDPFADPK